MKIRCGKLVENQSDWRAKLALACYFALIGGIFLGSFVVELVLFGMRIDYLDLPFPIALISVPVSDTIILGVTLVFARYKRASLKKLGLKKVSLGIVTVVSVAAVFLILLTISISGIETAVFGPDPMAESYSKAVTPRDSFQLVAMIALFLVLVGPVEELAFRGFIQKGFENSFGKMKGILMASVLFGFVHGLNTPYAIVPGSVSGLVLGYVWQRTGGNTTASALMHGVYNSIVIVAAYLITTV